MDKLRTPFQGVTNIIRFNWHFYVLAGVVLIMLSICFTFNNGLIALLAGYALLAVLLTTLTSLMVSCWVYDLSPLYSLNWVPTTLSPRTIVNVHAGFDETSSIIQHKYGKAALTVLDFYNPRLHTEVSIKRARKAYPAFPNTITVSTSQLPLATGSVDCFFIMLAAHEIRNDAERINFFQEVRRCLAPEGKIIVTEHLRDMPNFIAYNIGCFHFLPRKCWLQTFRQAQLSMASEFNITPFLTTFILSSHGTTP